MQKLVGPSETTLMKRVLKREMMKPDEFFCDFDDRTRRRGCRQKNIGDLHKVWQTANLETRQRILANILDDYNFRPVEDKYGSRKQRYLTVIWGFAHFDDANVDDATLQEIFNYHLKVLDVHLPSDKLNTMHRLFWLEGCLDDIKRDVFVLYAMRHFRNICEQCCGPCCEQNYTNPKLPSNITYLRFTLSQLETKINVTHILCDNLMKYVIRARNRVAECLKNSVDDGTLSLLPLTLKLDDQTDHTEQISERLSLLKYVLKEGKLGLVEIDAQFVWDCLISSPVFETDRDVGFKWFAEILSFKHEILESTIAAVFFERVFSLIQPCTFTESAMDCFEAFFKYVNYVENFFGYDKKAKKYEPLIKENFGLLGIDYLCRIILKSDDKFAARAIGLLIDYFEADPNLLPLNNGTNNFDGSFASFDFDECTSSVCSDKLTPKTKSTKRKVSKINLNSNATDDDVVTVDFENEFLTLEISNSLQNNFDQDCDACDDTRENFSQSPSTTASYPRTEMSESNNRIQYLERKLVGLENLSKERINDIEKLKSRNNYMSEENDRLRIQIKEVSLKLPCMEKNKKFNAVKLSEERDNLKIEIEILRKESEIIEEKTDIVSFERTAFKQRLETLEQEKKVLGEQKINSPMGADSLEEDNCRIKVAEATILTLQKNFSINSMICALNGARKIIFDIEKIIPLCSLNGAVIARKYQDSYKEIVSTIQSDLVKMNKNFDSQIRLIEKGFSIDSLPRIEPSKPPNPPPMLEISSLLSRSTSDCETTMRYIPQNPVGSGAVAQSSPKLPPVKTFTHPTQDKLAPFNFRSSSKASSKKGRFDNKKSVEPCFCVPGRSRLVDDINGSHSITPSELSKVWSTNDNDQDVSTSLTPAEIDWSTTGDSPIKTNVAESKIWNVSRSFTPSELDWSVCSSSPNTKIMGGILNPDAPYYIPTSTANLSQSSTASAEAVIRSFDRESVRSNRSANMNPNAAPWIPQSTAFFSTSDGVALPGFLEQISSFNDKPCFIEADDRTVTNWEEINLDAARLIKFAVQTDHFEDDVDLDTLIKNFKQVSSVSLSSSGVDLVRESSQLSLDNSWKERKSKTNVIFKENFLNPDASPWMPSSPIKITSIPKKNLNCIPPGFDYVSQSDVQLENSSERAFNEIPNVMPLNGQIRKPRPRFQAIVAECAELFPDVTESDVNGAISQYKNSLPDKTLKSLMDLKTAVKMILCAKFGVPQHFRRSD